MPRRTPATAGALAALTLTAVAVSATSAGASPNETTTPIAPAPAWVASTHATGGVPASTGLSLTVALPLADATGAEAFVRSVSDPHSAGYRHFLTPAQYTSRFAASSTTVDAVSSYLRSKGLSVGTAPSSHAYLPVTGSAAAVDAAFGTGLRTYRRHGQSVVAPSRATSVPTSLRGSISAVLGLDTSARVQTFHQGPDAARNYSKSCSTYYGQHYYPGVPKAPAPLSKRLPTYLCGYTPQQLQNLRQTPATGLTGRGATVGITLWCNDPRIESDTNHWARLTGWPTLKPGQYSVLAPANPYNPKYCDDQGSGGVNVEQALDVQSIHGAAPDAKIVYAPATAPFDYALIKALQRLVDSNSVDAITNSWGEVEAGVQPANLAAYRDVFLQAAAQGISVLFSSGDNSDNTNGDVSSTPAAANYPASDPWITSVGGTSVAPANASGTRLAFETGWNTAVSVLGSSGWSPWGYLFGGGGGRSAVFREPFYQKGVVPNRFTGRPAARAYPDLANVADPYTGYLIGYHDGDAAFGLNTIGGTSLASPYTAGTVALAVQADKGHRVGFLNPTLYSSGRSNLRDLTSNAMTTGFQYISSSSGNAITIGNNAQQVLNQTLRIQPGWDNITGNGVPSNTGRFVQGLLAGHTH